MFVRQSQLTGNIFIIMSMKRSATTGFGMVDVFVVGEYRLLEHTIILSSFFRFRCTRTDSCNVEKNITVTEYHCCEGFTSVPSSNYHYFYHKCSPQYIKKYGCPRGKINSVCFYCLLYFSLIEALQNSTLDCLEELGLTEFANLFSGLDLEDQLGTDNDTKFTVFAPPNELITNSNLGSLSSTDLTIVLGSHVVKRKLFSVRFYNRQKKRSLSPGRFIHVTEIYKRNDNNTDKVQ